LNRFLSTGLNLFISSFQRTAASTIFLLLKTYSNSKQQPGPQKPVQSQKNNAREKAFCPLLLRDFAGFEKVFAGSVSYFENAKAKIKT